MNFYVSNKKYTKVDWFVDEILYQTFDSYKHASEVLKKELDNDDINEWVIRKLIKNNGVTDKKRSTFKKIQIFKDGILLHTFKKNIEFAKFYNISKDYISCIINGKFTSPIFKDYEIKIIHTTPDVRLHVYNDDITFTCLYCEQVKPLNEQNFYYKNNETKIFKKKCIECIHKNNRLGTKKLYEFNKQLNDNWKSHPEFTYLYFERDTTKVFNLNSKCYIINNPVINNKEFSTRTLKWEAFYGEIPEHKIIKYKNPENIKNDNDGTELDNLECNYIYCESCEKIIKNPKTLLNKYCSNTCFQKNKISKHNENINNNLISYLSHKVSKHKHTNKKYKTEIDYDKNYLISLGLNCFYCGITCKFGYEANYFDPDILTYDKQNPDIGYIKENIVVCCFFCNRMKNQTVYQDWEQFIQFIKNDTLNEASSTILELDLSNKTFTTKLSKKNNLLSHIKTKSPSYYPFKDSTKKVFKIKCENQNYVDPFFHFFPIIYLEHNCLWNSSIDAIDPSLPKLEKHRPDNLQIIPKCFNFAKGSLSNEQFMNEWKKRGFKTDFTNCSIKLPENYYQQSYFNKFLSK